MFRVLTCLLGLLLLLNPPAFAEDLLVLCYHGVEPQVEQDPDAMTVTTDNLIGHINWLREHGWTAVSLGAIQAAKDGQQPLPEKAFLLTFDDGYSSVYKQVFPLLKAYKIPAVVALVTSWLETSAGEMVAYGNQQVPRDYFMSWAQLRDMAASGLVEIASHSHNLHRGVPGNPQGNEQPALTTRIWLPAEQRYETESEWQQRIRDDLQRSVTIITEQIGQPPRAIVWPYGRYNQPAIDIAAELGMPLTLTLDTVKNSAADLTAVGRILITNDPTTGAFVWQLQHRFERKIRRVAHVDIDYIYDTDSEQQLRNLSQLLDRIKALQINTVFLQAYADPDGDGVADQLYFPNRHLPVRADLFNRVAWQLKTRAGVDVFAWLPILSYTLEGGELVQRINPETGELEVDPKAPQRLTPFSAENRQKIAEIYEDLAIHASFAGILFSDDGVLSDFEDAGPTASDHYRQAWNLPGSVAAIRDNRADMTAWTGYKTSELINLTGKLMQSVEKWRPRSRSARNIFALPVLKPGSERWFAQELQAFAEAYDWVALMAMPWMEGASKPDEWLVELVDQVKRYPGVLDKTIFELQTLDWSKQNRWVPAHVIARQMDLLLRNGAVNYGYYPDIFTENHPNQKIIRPAISLREFPYERR